MVAPCTRKSLLQSVHWVPQLACQDKNSQLYSRLHADIHTHKYISCSLQFIWKAQWNGTIRKRWIEEPLHQSCEQLRRLYLLPKIPDILLPAATMLVQTDSKKEWTERANICQSVLLRLASGTNNFHVRETVRCDQAGSLESNEIKRDLCMFDTKISMLWFLAVPKLICEKNQGSQGISAYDRISYRSDLPFFWVQLRAKGTFEFAQNYRLWSAGRQNWPAVEKAK